MSPHTAPPRMTCHGDPTLVYALRELDVPTAYNFVDASLTRNVSEYGDRSACHFIRADGTVESTTWRALNDRVNQLGAGLRARGVSVGDRVLIGVRECPDLVACVMAVMRMGAVVVPFSAMARRREVADFVARVHPRALICDSNLADELGPLSGGVDVVVYSSADATGRATLDNLAGAAGPCTAPTSRDDLAVIFHTSGTTGRPKLCPHSQRALAAEAQLACRYNYRLSASDVVCSIGPAVHAFGFLGKVQYPLHTGASTVLMEEVSPRSVAVALEELRATHLVSGTMMWKRLLLTPTPPDMSSVKYLESLGPGDAVFQQLAAMGHHPRNSFGMVPLNGYITMVGYDEPLGSLGRALPGYEVYVVSTDRSEAFDDRGFPVELPPGEIGRLALRGPTGIRYIDDPDQAAADVVNGWSLLDDVFERDEAGYLWWRGRLSNVIKTNGYGVSPVEVEEVLALHPAVVEAAVFGTADDERGELVTAVVHLSAGCEPSDETVRELQAFVKSQLAPYKYPRRIEFVDAIPTDQLGKVRYAELKQRIAATPALQDL